MTKVIKNNKIIEKEFIPYEQALALKKLGFNEECFAFYGQMGANPSYLTMVGFEQRYTRKTLKAPLYQQTFRWFREKHNLLSYVDRVYEKGFYVYGYFIDKNNQEFGFKTYEEAELKRLKKLIKLVK